MKLFSVVTKKISWKISEIWLLNWFIYVFIFSLCFVADWRMHYWGAENYQPIEFSFSVEHMAAYKNASVMSSMVWIPTPSTTPGVYSCLIVLLGYLVISCIFSLYLKRKRSTITSKFLWLIHSDMRQSQFSLCFC